MLGTLSYQGLVDEVDAIMDVNPNDTHLACQERPRPGRWHDSPRIRQGLLLPSPSRRDRGREAFDSA